MKRLSILVPLFAAAAVLPLSLCAEPATNNPAPDAKSPAKSAELFPDSVIAKGKGVEVKRSQFEEQVIRVKSQAAAHGENIPPEQMGLLEHQILNQLIQLQLLEGKATDADKTSGKEAAAKQLDQAKTRFGSDEALNRQFKAMGTTREELLAKLTEQGTAEAVVKRELNVTVTDDQVKKFYEENPAKFEEPEMVRAAHILIGTRDQTTKAELTEDKKTAKRKLAEDLLNRARAGEDFGKLAKEYSEDPGSKDKGGEYTFPRGQMVAEFEAAAFSLNTNQISDIVTTQFGFHIIKLLEKMPAKKVDLAKVAPDVKESLAQQAMQKQFPDYITQLKKDAAVEILDDKLRKGEADAAAKAAKQAMQPETKPAAK
jgi:peptidyl-prolyl cis-trans isomerase C